jgi:hypothetical protein
VARLFLAHDPGAETLFGPLQMVDRRLYGQLELNAVRR